MKDQNQLTDYLVSEGVLKTQSIIDAFYEIDRKSFVREYSLDQAYTDHPLSIGYGVTISQPTTVAMMLERLEPSNGDKILDLGSGSCWTTALLSKIVGEKGFVYGIDIISEIVDFGNQNLKKYGLQNCSNELSGPKLGLATNAPYDKILVSAAAKDVPDELVGQLKIGGKMVISVKNSIYEITKISDQEINKIQHGGFSFVPLIY